MWEIMKKVFKFYPYIKPLIILIFSLILCYTVPFPLINKIPEKSQYSVKISIWTLIVGIFIAIVEEKISNRKAKIHIYYFSKNKQGLDEKVVKSINDNTSYVNFSIQINVQGNVKSKTKDKILIILPEYVTVQSKKAIYGGDITGNTIKLRLSEIESQILDFTIIKEKDYNGSLKKKVTCSMEKSSLFIDVIEENILEIKFS